MRNPSTMSKTMDRTRWGSAMGSFKDVAGTVGAWLVAVGGLGLDVYVLVHYGLCVRQPNS